MWLAKKDQNIGTRFVNSGEPIPEADEWSNRAAYVGSGFLEWVDDPPPTPALEVPPQSPEAPPPVVVTPEVSVPTPASFDPPPSHLALEAPVDDEFTGPVVHAILAGPTHAPARKRRK